MLKLGVCAGQAARPVRPDGWLGRLGGHSRDSPFWNELIDPLAAPLEVGAAPDSESRHWIQASSMTTTMTLNRITTAKGWHTDPLAEHDLRFNDGDTWTEHVTHFGPVPCQGCNRATA